MLGYKETLPGEKSPEKSPVYKTPVNKETKRTRLEGEEGTQTCVERDPICVGSTQSNMPDQSEGMVGTMQKEHGVLGQTIVYMCEECLMSVGRAKGKK